MTRNEFLEKLKEALSAEMDMHEIQSHLNYYTDYIDTELKNGQSEEDVLDELGDPWIIAKSLVEAPGNTYGGQVYESCPDADERRSSDYGGYEEDSHRVHVFGIDAWWKKLLLVIVIVGIVCLLFAIVSGIVSFVAPVAVPLIVLWLVVRFFKNRR